MPRDLIIGINLDQTGNEWEEIENGLQNRQHKAIMNSEIPSAGVGWGVSVALLMIWNGKVKGKLIESFKMCQIKRFVISSLMGRWFNSKYEELRILVEE